MEFTKNVQEKLGEAKSEEEVKAIIEETRKNVEEAGIVINDDELDEVAGGAGLRELLHRFL